MRTLRRRLRALFDRRGMERELDEELRSHLEMEIDYLVSQGMSFSLARERALRDFGGVERTKEEARDARGVGMLEDISRDIRFSTRSLRRTPVYAAAAVLTIALGIGVTTAVFSVVNGVLLRPLPFPEPDRIVRLFERGRTGAELSWTTPNFLDVRSSTRSLEGLAVFRTGLSTVLGADEPVRARTAMVSSEFFDVLRVRPLHGRTPTSEEGIVGGPRVALVSRDFWLRSLGGDSGFDRRTLIDWEDGHQVIGVMPAEFAYPAGVDVWFVIAPQGESRTAHNWSAIGRLAPGASLASARTEVDDIVRRLHAEHGSAMSAEGASVTQLHELLARSSRTTMLVLLGAVGFVLLVVCVNLASGNLARGEARRQELAVRTALGASRPRLVRQILTENLMLGVAGGALGVTLALGLTRLLATKGAAAIPGYASVDVDARVIAVGAALAIATGLLIGLAPALQVTGDVRGAIGGTGPAAAGPRRTRSRQVLIGVEVALAFALLAGAGLMIRSMQTLLGEELGLSTERVLAAEIPLPPARYQDPARTASFFDGLLPELRAIAGVEAVGLVNHLPLGGMSINSGFMLNGGDESVGSAAYRVVDSSYFATVGIPLLRGRGFVAGDRAGAEHVTLINAAMAARYWPGADPMGSRVRLPGMDLHPTEWLTIVGVVGNVRHDGLHEAPEPEMFIHYAQRPERLRGGATIVIRATAPAPALMAAVRERVRAADPDVPVRTSALEDLVRGSVAARRFSTLLLSGFAGLAVALAALGIYGVLAYSVAQRRREIGVRMALGAQSGRVRVLVLRDAMRAVLPGIALGVVAAIALGRVMRGMLYGVSTTDTVTYLAVALVLLAVAVVASWLPARRATSVNPMIAIRSE